MSRPPIEAIRSGYEALSRGDIDAWLRGVHVDATLHELADIPDSRVYRGHDEIRQWAQAAMHVVEEWQWTPEELLHEGDDWAVVRTRFSARGAGSGAPVEQVIFHVLEFRDGRMIRIRGSLDRNKALEAVGLSE
jgi:ketosteroid isomerase-like protein